MRDATERRHSFNVIHLRSYFKADIFVSADDELSRTQASRARRFEIQPGRGIVVASPEDIVAHKLYWYQLGDCVSERQWSDVLGVLKVAEHVDFMYLDW